MKNLQKHTIKSGLLVAVGLIAFFLTMEIFGLVHNFNLRVLNGVIVFGGIFQSLRLFKKGKFNEQFSYIAGIGVGFFISLISTVVFVAFMVIYLLLNPEFMLSIKANEPQGIYMNEFAVVLLILIEGVAAGLLFTYAAMQILKL